jgi:hypothetical protein
MVRDVQRAITGSTRNCPRISTTASMTLPVPSPTLESMHSRKPGSPAVMRHIAAFRFGRGSVGAAKARSVSSAFSHRTGLSELPKILVSMVRFRPWPPLPTRLTFSRISAPAEGSWESVPQSTDSPPPPVRHNRIFCVPHDAGSARSRQPRSVRLN